MAALCRGCGCVGVFQVSPWLDAPSERGARPVSYAGAARLGLIAIVVSDYHPAISFFVNGLGFALMENSPALTNNGSPKRWSRFRPSPRCARRRGRA
jgi:hypothetical protein